MIEGVKANFKYQGSEQEILLPLKKPTWKQIVDLLRDSFHLPKDCCLYLTYIDDSESEAMKEDGVVTASHDEDLENLWILMIKKKQLDLDVHLSNIDSHVERSSGMHHPKARGNLGANDGSKRSQESYLRAKKYFLQQEKQMIITNQEVEQIFSKILHLPEAQQLWKAGCLEIVQKKKRNLEENQFVTFDKVISEGLTKTLTIFTNNLIFKHQNPDLGVEEEEKKEKANNIHHRSSFIPTQIQPLEMHESEIRSSSTDSVPLYLSMLEIIPKSAPVEHLAIPKVQKKKEDPEPIHIIIRNDFKKEFVLQIKEGKAKLLAQNIAEIKENQN